MIAALIVLAATPAAVTVAGLLLLLRYAKAGVVALYVRRAPKPRTGTAPAQEASRG